LNGPDRILTPPDPERRGAQLSIQVEAAAHVQQRLQQEGAIGDFRQPDVLRLAPCPLFNTYHEMWRVAEIFRGALQEES
jgi:kynureninase